MDVAIPLGEGNINERNFKTLLKEELKDTKIDVFKNILKDKNISYDNEIADFNKLQKSVYKKLNKSTISEIESKMEKTNHEVLDVLDLIKDETDTNMQKVFDKLNSKVISPVAKITLFSILTKLIYTALVTLPTPVRTISGVVRIIWYDLQRQ